MLNSKLRKTVTYAVVLLNYVNGISFKKNGKIKTSKNELIVQYYYIYIKLYIKRTPYLAFRILYSCSASGSGVFVSRFYYIKHPAQ
jgi:hypothetical protein